MGGVAATGSSRQGSAGKGVWSGLQQLLSQLRDRARYVSISVLGAAVLSGGACVTAEEALRFMKSCLALLALAPAPHKSHGLAPAHT